MDRNAVRWRATVRELPDLVCHGDSYRPARRGREGADRRRRDVHRARQARRAGRGFGGVTRGTAPAAAPVPAGVPPWAATMITLTPEYLTVVGNLTICIRARAPGRRPASLHRRRWPSTITTFARVRTPWLKGGYFVAWEWLWSGSLVAFDPQFSLKRRFRLPGAAMGGGWSSTLGPGGSNPQRELAPRLAPRPEVALLGGLRRRRRLWRPSAARQARGLATGSTGAVLCAVGGSLPRPSS